MFSAHTRQNGVIIAQTVFYVPALPTVDHRFDEVLLLGLDLLHVQANGLLGFGRDIRDLDFMGNAFGRQQARQFGA